MQLSRELSARAMLSGLFFSQWSGRKNDKAVAQEITTKHGTDLGAVRARKRLIADTAFAEVRNIVTEARKYHYFHTMAWDDKGYRVLPSASYFEYSAAMTAFRDRFDTAADLGCELTNYTALKAAAKKALGTLYREEDYPAASAIRSKFEFRFKIKPFPVSDDFRVTIGMTSESDVAKLKAQIEDDVRQSVMVGMQDVYQRLYKELREMVEKLAAYTVDDQGKVSHPFRDTMLSNVQQVLDVLPRLNLTNDPILNDLAAEIQERLMVDARDLRDDAVVRERVLLEADLISQKMAAYMTPVTEVAA